MNPVIRATFVLAGLLVLLVAVDVGVRFVGQAPPTELPRLAPVELVAVRRVAVAVDDDVGAGRQLEITAGLGRGQCLVDQRLNVFAQLEKPLPRARPLRHM